MNQTLVEFVQASLAQPSDAFPDTLPSMKELEKELAPGKKAEKPTSDFDKAVEQVRQLESKERKTARRISSKVKKRPAKRKKENGRHKHGG